MAVPDDSEVTEADLVRKLSLSKSTISYRVRQAVRGGWLCNHEQRKGYPARLVRGAPLPEDSSPLPTREEVEAAQFEQRPNSNTYSNGHQASVAVAQKEQPFDGSTGEVEVEVDEDDHEHVAR